MNSSSSGILPTPIMAVPGGGSQLTRAVFLHPSLFNFYMNESFTDINRIAFAHPSLLEGSL